MSTMNFSNITTTRIRRAYLPGHNNNRHLTSEELENNISGLAVTETRLRELFDAFDRNNNGYLEFHEVRHIYQQQEDYGLPLSDAEVDAHIRRYAKTDRVNYDEFSAIVLSLAQR